MVSIKNILFVAFCCISSLAAQVTDISDQNQYNQAIKSGLVVVKFSAHWCPPCQKIKPYFVQLSNDAYKNVKFYAADIDHVRSLADSLGIQSIPTFVFFVNGQRTKTFTGSNRAALKKALDDFASKK